MTTGRVFLYRSRGVSTCSLLSGEDIDRSPTSGRVPWLYLAEIFLKRLNACDADRRSRLSSSDIIPVLKYMLEILEGL